VWRGGEKRERERREERFKGRKMSLREGRREGRQEEKMDVWREELEAFFFRARKGEGRQRLAVVRVKISTSGLMA